MELFDRKSHYFALSQIPKTFIGLNVSSGRAEKINDLLKVKIPYETSIAEVVMAMDSLTDELDSNVLKFNIIDKSNNDKLFRNPSLSKVKEIVPKAIFPHILQTYIRSLGLAVERLSNTKFRVTGKHIYTV